MEKKTRVAFDIVGLERQVSLLSRTIEFGNLQNAYIFHGPRGTGKKRVAAEFVKAVLCEDEHVRPCKTCKSCRAFVLGTHPDIELVRPASQGESIGVDTIRDFRTRLYEKPVYGSIRFGIVYEADTLSAAAANSLLKVAEDGPSSSCLIIITHSLLAIPVTLRSRSQLIKFHRMSSSALRSVIDVRNLSDEEIDTVIALSGGKLSACLSLVDDGLKLYRVRMHRIMELLRKSRVDALTGISDVLTNEIGHEEKYREKADRAREYLDLLETVLRDLLVFSDTAPLNIKNTLFKDQMRSARSLVSKRSLLTMLDHVFIAKEHMLSNLNLLLNLENIFVSTSI